MLLRETAAKIQKRLHPTVKRDLSLFSVEAWQAGYTVYLEESLGWRYDVIFRYDGERVHFYHTEDDFAYFKKTVTRRLIEDDNLFISLNSAFQENIRRLRKTMRRIETKNIPDIFELIGKIMSFYIFVVSDAFVTARPAAWKSRKMSEGVLYEADERVEKFLRRKLRGLHTDESLAHALRRSEICFLLAGQTAPLRAAAKRKTSYILFNDELLAEPDFRNYCAKRRLINPEDKKQAGGGSINGSCAYGGYARGRARIVRSRLDLAKIRHGDILVAVMTNITYTPAIKKSAAIVTDEGGITCHAAIVARELKKPCIIGTKIATQVLKDGDLVEVDAGKEVVRVLKRPHRRTIRKI